MRYVVERSRINKGEFTVTRKGGNMGWVVGTWNDYDVAFDIADLLNDMRDHDVS